MITPDMPAASPLGKPTNYQSDYDPALLFPIARQPKREELGISGTLRMLSGTPFTIQDDTIDEDMNRINFSPLPAGAVYRA